MTQRLLIIDDDVRLAAMLGRYLGERGYDVSHQPDASGGLVALRQERFDALILDVMLPDGDGFDVCRRVRTFSQVPILMLTARGDELDRIVGLELGADDYLPKPFNPRELLARLNAILRRQRPAQAETSAMRFGPLLIDQGAREVRLSGEICRLTSHQYELLVALASRAGRVQSREQLIEAVHGELLAGYERSVDVHISRIRAALESDPRQPRFIRTVRGAGYVFTPPSPGD